MENRQLHAPVHTVLLSVVQIAMALSSQRTFGHFGYMLEDRRGTLPFALLVHKDGWHLLNNLGVSVPFGFMFESLNGHLGTACVFWLGGIFGLGVQTYAMGDDIVLGGASPGCLALISAMLGHAVINWTSTPFKRTLLLLVLFYCVMTIVTAAVDPSENVAHVSHIAGLGHGVLTGTALCRNDHYVWWEKHVRRVAAFAAVASVIFVMLVPWS